jgi:hypothetical protein
LFRAPSFPSAMELLRGYFLLKRDGIVSLPWMLSLLPIGLLLLQLVLSRAQLMRKVECLPGFAFSFGMGVLAATALALLPLGNRPFIYFQF